MQFARMEAWVSAAACVVFAHEVIMSNKFNQVEWENAVEVIKHEGDRTAGIVAASMIELVIDTGITSRLIPISNTFYDVIFGDRGPLGTFSAKIDIGFALGLYGPTAKSDLHKIRAIRNQFAHQLSRDFGHEKVVEICETLTEYSAGKVGDDLLKYYKENELDKNNKPLYQAFMRGKFMLAIANIHSGIVHEGRIVRRPEPPTQLA